MLKCIVKTIYNHACIYNSVARSNVYLYTAQLISTECLLASNGTLSLPNFGRPFSLRRFRMNSIQAIISSYQFNCHGVITEWATFVDPMRNQFCYSISFEVWRPGILSGDNCYVKVGANFVREVCSLRLAFADPKRGLVNVTVPENERIYVEPGDVVGFNLTNMGNRQYSGIVFSNDDLYTNELVWFREINSNTAEKQSICNAGQFYMSTRLAPLVTAQLGELFFYM